MSTLTLSDVADIQPGAQTSKSDMDLMLIKGTHHFLTSKNIKDGKINFHEADKVRYKSINWFEKYEVKSENLLISYTGDDFNIAIVPSNSPDSFCSASIVRVILDDELFNPHVMKFYLESKDGKARLESCVKNRILSTKLLKSLPIPEVEPEVQRELGRSIQLSYRRYMEAIAKEEAIYRKKEEEIRNRLNF